MTSLTKHQAEALNFKQHISLTANAGSGKTFVLSRRYLKIATETNLPLRNIAAITFTDKAASELYKKIATNIDQELESATDQNYKRNLEKIRRDLVSANISTIHSFCIDILREFPVEAGLDANFSPIDENLSDELIELSVDEVIKDSLVDENDSDKIKILIRIFASKSLLEKQLISLVKHRKNVLGLADEIYSKGESEISKLFRDQFDKYFIEIFSKRKHKLIQCFNIINSEILSDKKENKVALPLIPILEKLDSSDTSSEIIKNLNEIKETALTQKYTVKAQGYVSAKFKDLLAKEIQYVEEFFADYSSIRFVENADQIEKQLAVFGKDIIYFLDKSLNSYEEKKRENSYLDYEDILLNTQKILLNDEVKKALGEKYQYIMIDEYQDTNELQYRVFLPILDYLNHGNLFVVGDEKQSIYMFRDAELEVFDRTKEIIKTTSGDKSLLSLPDSFRMAPLLCLFTNVLFQRLFSDPNTMFNEVNHSDLVCARNDYKEIKGSVELLLASEQSEAEDEKIESEEAELVAKRILKLVNEEKLSNEIKYGDIAILCRKRKSFSELEKTFVKYKIPFLIIGGKGFYQRQIIYDIYNYFSFLLDSKNDTALVGILRSPFFNLSDSTIYEISLEKGFTFWSKLREYVKKDSTKILSSNLLSENLELVRSVDIVFMLRKILKESSILAVAASRANGEQEIANLEKLIKVTIGFSSQGFNTLYDYVNFLKESIEGFEDESQAAVSDENNSVKIMTLHQSKGLEYPAVFLYKCEERTSADKIKSKSISVDKKFGLLTKLPLNSDYFAEYEDAPINGISQLILEKKNLAELKRLFYVGITRAKNHLFISATISSSGNFPKESFLGLLDQGLKLNYDNESFQIDGKLTILENDNGNYKNLNEQYHLEVPITREIKEVYTDKKEIPVDPIAKKLVIQSITDIPKNEIISATKVAVYQQCPLKYQLTYEYGFGSLMNQYKNWFKDKNSKNYQNYEFNSAEEIIGDDKLNYSQEENLYKNLGDVKGRVIHKILQKEIDISGIKDFAFSSLGDELSSLKYSEKEANELSSLILEDLNKFYSSSSFNYVHSFKNYKNEFEVYVKRNDYILYGIIDRLIIDNDKIVIVDYKTDDIAVDEIEERSLAYITQLKFYAFILEHLFPGVTEFELRLIFIKHPDSNVVTNLKRNDLTKFGEELNEMIDDIRHQTFDKNTNHCAKCLFAMNSTNCIKE